MPTIDLLDDDVDFTPARHLRSEPDVADLRVDRERLVALIARLVDLASQLPHVGVVAEHSRTTVGELVRQSALTIHQQVGPMDVDTQPGTLVLTSPDVVARRGPSGSTPADTTGVRLRSGDVVVPTIASRPAAVVVEDESGALLGPGL